MIAGGLWRELGGMPGSTPGGDVFLGLALELAGREAVVHDRYVRAGGDQAGGDATLLGLGQRAPVAAVDPEQRRAARGAWEPIERVAGRRVEHLVRYHGQGLPRRRGRLDVAPVL